MSKTDDIIKRSRAIRPQTVRFSKRPRKSRAAIEWPGSLLPEDLKESWHLFCFLRKDILDRLYAELEVMLWR